ncbi:MAG: DUF2061 domain-containing protein [Pseudomonadota bacterium]
MDSPARTIAKTLTWQTSGFLSMVAITWIVTGSVASGGAVAGVATLIGTVSYLVHERIWACIRWGRVASH